MVESGNNSKSIPLADSDLKNQMTYTLGWTKKKLTILKGFDQQKPETQVIDAQRKWARPPPDLFVDLSDSSAIFQIPGKKRFAHAKLLTNFGRVDVFGSHHFHGFLLENGDLGLHETANVRVDARMQYLLANSPPSSYPVPQVIYENNEYYCAGSLINREEVIPINGDVFFASPVEPDNWGMWLLNALSSVDYMLVNQPESKLLCWAHATWQFDLLKFMGLPNDKLIVQEPWRLYSCDNLSMHRYTKIDLIPTPTDLELFSRIKAEHFSVRMAGHSKIFVSRKTFTLKGGYRGLVNEDELIAGLTRLGFKVVEPELLKFEDQIRVFASADIVIGLAGAAMFNTIFCKPGTLVLSIESTTKYVLNHANLFGSLNLPYGFIIGEEDSDDVRESHKKWYLDVPKALMHIQAFIS
jgi:hypothetical protein